MNMLFSRIFNMSVTASVMVLSILVIRILFNKNITRKTACYLWALVAVRLLCPILIHSSLSIYNLFSDTIIGRISNQQIILHTEDRLIFTEVSPGIHSDRSLYAENQLTTNGLLNSPILSTIWAAGIIVLLGFGILRYVQIKKSAAASIKVAETIFISDDISGSFVIGLFHPKMYLASGMEPSVEAYVIAHERAHIERKDHIWKPLGFLLLSVYWFNPLLWVSYILFCRDIEGACDERVIADFDYENKIQYSHALLQCSMGRRIVSVVPVAFGDTDVKGRIRNVLNYKKHSVLNGFSSLLLCAVLSACFLTNPVDKESIESVSIGNVNMDSENPLTAFQLRQSVPDNGEPSGYVWKDSDDRFYFENCYVEPRGYWFDGHNLFFVYDVVGSADEVKNIQIEAADHTAETTYYVSNPGNERTVMRALIHRENECDSFEIVIFCKGERSKTGYKVRISKTN